MRRLAAGKHRSAAAAAIFVLAFAFYCGTAAPEFLFDDNPEFIASAHMLGITHPPGYPVFSLTGKLTSYLIPGEIPFAVNLESSIAGAVAVTLAFFFLTATGTGTAAGALGAALVCCARTFWGEAVQAEVYANNLLFFFAILNLSLGLKGGRSDTRRIAAIALFAGIGLINHYSFALVIPVIALYIFYINGLKVRRLAAIAAIAVFTGALALSVTAYLPLRSAASPPISWKNQTTPRGLASHLKGVDRRSKNSQVPIVEKWKMTKFYFTHLSRQWFPFFLAFIPIGIYSGIRRNGARYGLILALWAAQFFGYLILLNYIFSPRTAFVMQVFHITSIALAALIAAEGIHFIIKWHHSRKLPAGAVTIMLAAAIVFSIKVNSAYSNSLHEIIPRNYVDNILRTVERDGIVFSHLETDSFPISLTRAVYGKRRDILLFGNQGDRAEAIYTEGKLGGVDKQLLYLTDVESHVLRYMNTERPIYFTVRRNLTSIPGSFMLTNGLLYKLNPNVERLIRFDPWKTIDMKGIDLNIKTYDYNTINVIDKYYIMHAERYIEEQNIEKAISLFDDILKFNPKSSYLHASIAAIYISIGRYDYARREYEAALGCELESAELGLESVAIYNNLSYLYGRAGMQEKALEMIENAVELSPKSPVLLVNLGKTYWQMDKCPQAIPTLNNALKYGKDLASLRNILGICYEKGKKFDKAEREYKRALSLDPNMPDVYRDFGIYNLYTAGNTTYAVMLLERYLTLARENATDVGEIHATIGFVLSRDNKCEAALPHFDKALRFGADTTRRRRAMIHSGIASCQSTLGNDSAARKAFDMGKDYADDYPEILRDYAAWLESRGDNSNAIPLYDQYLKLNPIAKDRYEIENKLIIMKNKLQ